MRSEIGLGFSVHSAYAANEAALTIVSPPSTFAGSVTSAMREIREQGGFPNLGSQALPSREGLVVQMPEDGRLPLEAEPFRHELAGAAYQGLVWTPLLLEALESMEPRDAEVMVSAHSATWRARMREWDTTLTSIPIAQSTFQWALLFEAEHEDDEQGVIELMAECCPEALLSALTTGVKPRGAPESTRKVLGGSTRKCALARLMSSPFPEVRQLAFEAVGEC